jgi:hypothetical protein
VNAHLLELHPGDRDVIVKPLDAEHRLDARDELLFLERFAYVIVGADLEALDAARAVGFHGDEHDGQEGLVGHPLQEPARLEPRQARHHDVQEHQTDPAPRNPLDRLLAVVARLDDVAMTAQDVGEQLARQTIVVGHEKGGLGWPRRRGIRGPGVTPRWFPRSFRGPCTRRAVGGGHDEVSIP